MTVSSYSCSVFIHCVLSPKIIVCIVMGYFSFVHWWQGNIYVCSGLLCMLTRHHLKCLWIPVQTLTHFFIASLLPFFFLCSFSSLSSSWFTSFIYPTLLPFLLFMLPIHKLDLPCIRLSGSSPVPFSYFSPIIGNESPVAPSTKHSPIFMITFIFSTPTQVQALQIKIF